MPRKSRTRQRVPNKSSQLQNNFEETEETLRAIHQGLVDALLVKHSKGTQVVTFSNADFPYRLMVESMNEGAVTLIPDGTIFYCNSRLGEMLDTDCEKLVGKSFQDLVVLEEQSRFQAIFQNVDRQGTREEFTLQSVNGSR